MAYQSKYKGKEIEDILDNALLKKEQSLTDNEKNVVKKNLGIEDQDLSDYATKKDVEDAISKIPTPDVSGQIASALVDYVKKVEGKGLSTNDFTNELKEKLEGITPYDPSELEAEIGKLETALNTLVSGNASNAIESFNEIIAFLENVSDTESLSGIIAGINTRIAEVEGKIPTKVSQIENDLGFAKKSEVDASIEEMYRIIGTHNKEVKFFCIEPVTVVVGEQEYHFEANQAATVFVGDADFEIIPTSNESIQSLLGYPIPLTWHDWMEGVDVFDSIVFDMNELDTYMHWIQYYQGEYHVQKAQYSNCVFWSDNPYTHSPFEQRTNYTLYYSAQLPLCYSTIPANTYKPFYLAYGVKTDPNWNNSDYLASYAIVSGATQTFSYYGASAIGIFDMGVDIITLPKDCRGLMYHAPAIQYAGVFDAKNSTNFGAKKGSWQEAFGACYSLQTLYIRNLKTSINVSWSPLNNESIEYIVNNAINTTTITISVSPYTWNRLTDAIKSAATAKKINIALLEGNMEDDNRLKVIPTLATKDELKSKQDVISDLANIREGAAKGATAIQEEQYKGTVAAIDTDESVDDPNIPSGSYDDTEIKKQIKENADNIAANKEYADAKLSELGSKVDEISKSISPTITNLQIDGLLDSLDKIKETYHDPILSLYDGGIKVSPTLDSSKPYPNIYLADIGTFDKDETFLVLADIYNIGGGLLQFYLGKNPYLQESLEKKRKVIENIVTIPAGARARFRLQNLNEARGEYVIYAVMVFKVPDNIPSDEFQRNILNYYNTVGYKQSYGGVMDSEHSNSASVADRLKVKDIELWGDSLTEQNYGKYISGANVSVHGFGGKTSTYIRDKFLSDADKKASQVIWVGRNNYYEADVIIDDVRDMVSALEHNDFIIMCPPNGYYGTFGTNGSDGTGEMKGGSGYSKFLKLEKILSEEYPSNFLNIRKAVIEGWRMGNVKLLSDFVQPSVGGNVTIEVSDATFLTTYNGYDVSSFGEDFMSKIRIGVNEEYDVYKIVEKADDTHLIVQLEEINRISSGNIVGNVVDEGGTNSIKYLRVMQNADYMCWLYDTTLSTFRKDGIHMTEDGLKLVAQIVSRKLASMKLL